MVPLLGLVFLPARALAESLARLLLELPLGEMAL